MRGPEWIAVDRECKGRQSDEDSHSMVDLLFSSRRPFPDLVLPISAQPDDITTPICPAVVLDEQDSAALSVQGRRA